MSKKGWFRRQWEKRKPEKVLVEVTSGHPVIHTPMGPVTERWRLQAALNMKADPKKMAQAIEMIGEAEARRRYPEAWSSDEN